MVCGFTVDVLYIIYCILVCVCFFFFSSRRRHTRCALVTGVQTCALPICWLFPESDHNPRAKAIRAAIKHAPGQTVSLHVNGKPADPLTFEGVGKSADGGVAVSLWRGLEIREGENHLVAEVKDANGATIETLERTVHYSITPMRATLIRERSVLVADGVTRPVIAVRLTDRDGKPIRAGLARKSVV